MPVVYVHGNAGSFRTIRSLAVAQNLFTEYHNHFNYYTVDFNEEYTVLSGRLLQAQSDFLFISIDAVLQRNPAWSSVVLVSHSIGTTVALNLLANPDFNQSKISHIISLAGPLQRPVISPGPALDWIYERVHNVLAHFLEQQPDLDGHSRTGRGTIPVLLSLTGGSRDVLIHDNLGDLGLSSAPPAVGFLWLTTTSIAHVWATCDHKAILWCRQLMIVLTVVMEKLKLVSSSNEPTGVDPPYSLTQSLRQLLSTRPSQLTQHLVSPVMTLTKRAPVSMSSLAPGRWNFLTDTRLRYLHADESHSDQHLYVKIGPFFDNPKNRLLLLAGGVNYQDDWLYWCLVDGRMEQKSSDRCTHLVPVLSEDASTTTSSPLLVLPPSTSTKTAFQVACLLSLDPIETSSRPGYLLVIRPRLAKLTLTFEVIEDFQGHVTTLSNQNVSIVWWPFKAQVKLHNAVHIRPPHLSTVYHRIILPVNRFFFQQSLPALRLIIQAQRCNQHAPKDGLLTFFTPWNDYFYHHSIPSSPSESVTVALDVPSQPPRRLWSSPQDDDGDGWEDRSAIIDLYLNPGCEYTIFVQRSLLQWIAKLFLLHGTHLLGFISSHVLLSVMLFAAQRWWWWLSCTNTPVPISRHQQSAPSHRRPPTKKGDVEEHHPCSAQDRCFSLGYHVSAGLFHFLVFQFIDLPISDWQRMQLTGEVGLRWSDTRLLGLSSLDRLVAMAPLGLLLLPISLLIAPVGVRLGFSLVDLVIRWSVHLVHNLTGLSTGINRDESGSKSEQQRLDVLVTLFIFALSLTCSEALGVLLSAGHIFWKLGRTTSGIRRSRQVEVHHLAGLTVLTLSTQLLESWHTLVSGVWQIAKNRGLTLEQLWLHLPQLEWPITLGLIAVALSDCLLSSPACQGHHHQHHHWLLLGHHVSLPIGVTSALLCFLLWTMSFHTAIHLSTLFCTSAWCLLTCLFAHHLIPDLSSTVVLAVAGGHADWSLGKAKRL